MFSLGKPSFLLMAFILFSSTLLDAQVAVDSSQVKKEYSSLDDALKSPENVYRLNLSNQKIVMPSDSVWSRFVNLEYLSLKNDHLTSLPPEFGSLKKLRVLDLSGNDFKVLPQSLSGLESLTELYLNDEKEMDINRSLSVIESLPNLRILHLENDNLGSIPENLFRLKNLDTLYLNNNEFKQMPMELESFRNLKYLDLHDNKYRLDNRNVREERFGFKVNF